MAALNQEDKTLYAPDLISNELLLIKKHDFDMNLLEGKKFNIYQLAEIRKGLETGVDVTVYLDPTIPWNEMEEIRLELQSGIDMTLYREAGFDIMQLAEIREGLQEGLDVSEYAREEFFADQMRQIRYGLEKGLPIIFYQDPSLNWLQMAEIRKGLESGTDISKYARAELPYMKMRVVRESLEDGLELDEHLVMRKDASTLEQIHLAFKEKINIDKYVNENYDADQLEQIRYAKKIGLEDIDKFFTFSMTGECMHEIIKGLEQNLDVSVYADEHYSWKQMRELRKGLEHQVDVKCYAKPLYRADQMREIRRGLEANVDVSQYSSMVHPAQEMRVMREWLEQGRKLPRNLSTLFSGKAQEDLLSNEDEEIRIAHFLRTEEGRLIEMSEDRMKGYFTIPVGRFSSKYTLEYIVKLLFKAGIKRGISKKTIENMIEFKKFGVRVQVASGKYPEDGKDGYYEFMKDLDGRVTPDMTGADGADFSRVKIFSDVKVGDKLAIYHPATSGVDGYTITGKILKAGVGKGKPILKGTGFMLLGDKQTYVASVSGVGRMSGGELIVDKLKVYDSLVNIRDKISCDGSVWVKGDVDNVYIQAKGDVLVDGSISCADVNAGGRVVVKKSIVGNVSDRAVVIAGGMVAAAHVDNADIRCGGDLLSNDCLACSVSAGGMVVMLGERGLISGGLVTSMKGVETAILGSKAVKETVIRTGVTEELDHEYQDLMKKLSRTYQEIKVYENQRAQLQTFNDVTNKQALQIKIKINAESAMKEAELEKLNARKDEIEKEMEAVKEANVRVSGMVFNGTSVKIGNRILRVRESRQTQSGIVFKTDEGYLVMYDGERPVARS